MMLFSYLGKVDVALVKSYWLRYYSFPTCFKDMRQLVANLSTGDQKDFMDFISTTASSLQPREPYSKVCKNDVEICKFIA